MRYRFWLILVFFLFVAGFSIPLLSQQAPPEEVKGSQELPPASAVEIAVQYGWEAPQTAEASILIIDEVNVLTTSFKNVVHVMSVSRIPVPPPPPVKPKPQVIKPKPQVIKPAVEVVKPKPKPKPEVIKPKPEVIKPTVEVVKPKPKPEVIKPKPEVIKPKPQVIKPRPEVIKPTVEVIKPQPKPVLKPFIVLKKVDLSEVRPGDMVTFFIEITYHDNFGGIGWEIRDTMDMTQVEIIEVTGMGDTDYKGSIHQDGYYAVIKTTGSTGQVGIAIKVRIK